MNSKSQTILLLESIKNFNFPQNNPSRKDISLLHLRLSKLGLVISSEEIKKEELGFTTIKAIKELQISTGLPPSGIVSEDTIKKLRQLLEHNYYAKHKTRTENLHLILDRMGFKIAADEKTKRIYGPSTENAIKEVQNKLGLVENGLLSEDLVSNLKEQEIRVRFNSKTQVGKRQRLLLKAGRVAKLDIKIDSTELKGKRIGTTTSALISALQDKYNLEPTGNLNRQTYEKISSIAASHPPPIKKLVVKNPDSLPRIKGPLRLNANNDNVGQLQKTLGFLGYKITEKEFKMRKFGKTTREAVLEYQRSNHIPITGHVDGVTLKKFNQYISEINPSSIEDYSFRLKGSVRDDIWNGKPKVKVQIWEKIIHGRGKLLAERSTLSNGFFDIPYDPPRYLVNNKIKKPFHLEVKAIDSVTGSVITKSLFNPTLISWINFTDGNKPYRGISEYELRMKAVDSVLNGIPIEDIEETDERQDVSQTALNSGLSQEEVMKLILSHRIAKKIDKPEIKAEVYYAFLTQNLPPRLPDDLLTSLQDWTKIENRIETILSGLIFMKKDLQSESFDNAINENLIPISLARQKDQIMTVFDSIKQVFILEKPVLTGNESLKSIFQTSQLAQQHYNKVANAFITAGGSNSEFWEGIRANAGEIGGEAVVTDLETSINLGYITKHHIATLTFLKNKMADPNDTDINNVKDMARLTHEQILSFIEENGGQVPDWIEANTSEEKISTYADILRNQSELLYPSIAFVFMVSRSNRHSLTKIAEIGELVYTNDQLDIRNNNLDKYVNQKQLNVPKEVLSELKVLQRMLRISLNASVARVLIDEKIHHSTNIISRGKDNFVKVLRNNGIAEKTALTVFSNAEFQYAEILSKIGEYRFELHRTNPKAIVKHTYSDEEQQEFLNLIPDLQTLFGSLDFCDCSHCQSVFSPAAYVADILNFLQNQISEVPSKSVRDILLDRRPDIGNIKLNCENSDTPLPYIDLVCEILEGAIPSPVSNSNFSFQTIRTKEELLAFPENIRKEVYNMLINADFPMNTSFNLWQEESCIFLQHLGVCFYELMEKLQIRPANIEDSLPSDGSIAGEYWHMSSHQTEIVTTTDANTAILQNKYWGFDCNRSQIPVAEFIRQSKIEYTNLLELLNIKWLNPEGASDNIELTSSLEKCNVDKQTLVNLTVDKFDRVHRFLRLWRHTVDWRMWELDLLLRCPKIATSGNIDAKTLVHLKQFREVQKKLGLFFEPALSLYQQINIETRIKPDKPNKEIPSLYLQLFQNQAITNPVNTEFALPLSGSESLLNHKPTLMAALGIKEDDLFLILSSGKITNDELSLSNLTIFYNYTIIANKLRISIKDLFILEGLTKIDPFASPEGTLNLIDTYDWIKDSGFQIQELDYLLNFNQDSPFGIREEVVTQYIENLRESLRNHTLDLVDGLIISQIAASFSITDEQSMLLLRNLDLQGIKILEHFKDDRLTKKIDGKYLDIGHGNFPAIYDSYYLLHKVTMLVKGHKIEDAKNLEWLLTKFGTFNSLNFSSVFTPGVPAESLIPEWLVLTKWLYFKAQYPEPETTSLRKIFDTASNQASNKLDILNNIAMLTQWKLDDLESLDSGWQLQHGNNSVSDYAKIDTYFRLLESIKLVKLTGTAAKTLLRWSTRDNNTDDAQFTTAQEIRQTAKSKYDYQIWLSKVVPIQDEIREKKRTALVNVLIENSIRNEPIVIEFNGKTYSNPRYWTNPSDLFGYFLIDVEMSACQPTSRIKQAMSSIQMFIQRCFLNLEQPFVEVSKEERDDVVSLNSWKQWKWMKNYRLWEAHLKVFLYPENWILPELRDDKTPFFVELEDEILQKDITSENVEIALSNYLQKVLEVSSLEILGVHHEVDDDSPYDDLPPRINLIHIIGKTKSQPVVYYYRFLDLNYNKFSAWETVDVDGISDHAIPVIYNRKLFIFWLVFTEKAQEVKRQPAASPTDSNSSTRESPQMLEIQIAWSVRKGQGWTPKKISHEKIIHPWPRPLFSYNLKPRYDERLNHLWLDIFITTSKEFNATKFYDPYSGTKRRFTRYGHVAQYNNLGRPFHSSSFVFDGNIIDIKLKDIFGYYIQFDTDGEPIKRGDYETSHKYVFDKISSLEYVQERFGENARKIGSLIGREKARYLLLPDQMRYHYTHLTTNKPYSVNPVPLNVLELGNTKRLIDTAVSPFALVFSQDKPYFDTAIFDPSPFFYQDRKRSFFIRQEWKDVDAGSDPNQSTGLMKYTFYTFYHPYAQLFVRELNRSGPEGLLNRRIQLFPNSFYPGNDFNFQSVYHPTPLTIPDKTTEKDIVDFIQYGAYSIYNWEIFFHIPFLVACKLSQNQQFEDAMRWFHFIFDPTNTEALGVPEKFWVTRPFFDQNSEDYRKQRIQRLLEDVDENADQVRAWKNNPFRPHLIARYRPIAYQKTIVMKYTDNLIAWGDQLFRRDTLESLNEATILYVLAYELLGSRPIKVPNIHHRDLSYNDLISQENQDPFGNNRVEVLMENSIPQPALVTSTEEGEPLPRMDISYFCIPNNDILLQYWDMVEDRLFKIRHCMNIEGIKRILPLFEPPIDPMLLVKTAAAGIDFNSILGDIEVSHGQYRYRVIVQKTLEFCAEVKTIGEKLLSVLEKKDAEELVLLRSVHEIEMLKEIKTIREKQMSEAKVLWESAQFGTDLLQLKLDYYNSVPRMNTWEKISTSLYVSAIASETLSAGLNLFAAGSQTFPTFYAGTAGSFGTPVFVTKWGGEVVANGATRAAQVFQAIASILNQNARLLETQGSYQRRFDEVKFQRSSTEKEIEQMDKQIIAAEIRHIIAEKELDNSNLQIAQSISIDEYMHNKYTNQQLYDWMLKQLSTVYFQSYQLAYDMAKRAEKSLKYELGRPDVSFIEPGYWDSLKKGLLAGEKLVKDIHRMEKFYYEENKRELEITKHISLAKIMPLGLIVLKQTGKCTITLPEWLYDMDYPGHYRRRVKSCSITIPCIVGPYTSLNCTVSLIKNGIRMSSSVSNPNDPDAYGDPLTAAADDERFITNQVPPIISIATSHGQNDFGVFELNFNDERYLPFEGAGAVSEWEISLPKENNQFNFATISDVVLHIKYTSISAGENDDLTKASKIHLANTLPTSGTAIYALKNDFSNEWHRFLHPAGLNAEQIMEFLLRIEHLPFYVASMAAGKSVLLSKLDLVIDTVHDTAFDAILQFPQNNPSPAETLNTNPLFGGLPHLEMSVSQQQMTKVLGDWKIKLKKSVEPEYKSLKPEDINNAYLVLTFKIG